MGQALAEKRMANQNKYIDDNKKTDDKLTQK
jgi:hypothetical protein